MGRVNSPNKESSELMACSICNELLGIGKSFEQAAYAEIVKLGQTILYTTENFSIIPSLGAINKSHILIVPHQHLLSFASVSQEHSDELYFIKEKLQKYNVDCSGQPLLFFEHGTGVTQNNSGACVEHAHLHGIFEIEGFHSAILSEVEMANLSNHKELHSRADIQNGYVYYEDSSKTCWLANNPDVPSQYFRFCYARISNSELEWNWKKHGNIASVNEVISYYKYLSIFT